MKGIQISLDGKVICNASHTDMSLITGTLHLLRDDKAYRFIVSGRNDTDDNLTQILRYLDISISDGQELVLKVVDIENPSTPDKVSNFGTFRDPKNPDDVHFCSFCGKSEKEVNNMLIGISGNICNDCITSHAAKYVAT